MKNVKPIPNSFRATDNIRADGNCIDEDELPVRADLKLRHAHDPDREYSQEDINDRDEFVRCYLLGDFEPLLLLPLPVKKTDFFIKDFEESAFNTMDFYRQYGSVAKPRPVNKLSRVLEEVKQMAILHSCLASPAGRDRMRKRYQQLINREYRNLALNLEKKYRNAQGHHIKSTLRLKISRLNQAILRCQRVWERHAPWDG
jgi:hypothetical protein